MPGTKGLVTSEEDALKESEKLGYPIMLKATAGGGGMGLVVCEKAEDVKEGFRMVQSRGKVMLKGAIAVVNKAQAKLCSKAGICSSRSTTQQVTTLRFKYSATAKEMLSTSESGSALFSAEIRR